MARIDIKFRFEPGRVDVDTARWEAYARDPSGPIVRDIVRRTNNVESAARLTSPEDTGRLKTTYRSQLDFGGRLPAGEMIAGRDGLTPYVGYLIHGTAPHVITPTAKKALRFVSGGQVVFSRRVNHPGTRSNDWLERALLRAAD